MKKILNLSGIKTIGTQFSDEQICQHLGIEVPQFIPMFDDGGHLRKLEQIERDLIQYAIDLYAGHMTEIARRLGIGRSTLYRKLKEYDLEEFLLKISS